mmetsp:Transcript_34218/g.59867  ORF Transcript_34218/g.59867 Transcript_34218/m.59867 type:complete len:311 (-) Transcript_34218:1182-2114(-)
MESTFASQAAQRLTELQTRGNPESVEVFRKAVEVLSTEQDDSRKAASLAALLADFYNVSKRTEMELVSSRKKLSTASRERESLYTDLSNERQVRTKLDHVCTEIRETNSKIEEELEAVKGDEEAKRNECKGKMERTLTELSSKLEETSKETSEMRAHNDMLKEKIDKLLKEVEERDKYYTQLVSKKDAEIRAARMAMQNTGQLSLEAEHEMRQQLQLYELRFSEFEDTINRSEEAFSNFRKQKVEMQTRETQMKQEIETMQKEAYGNDVKLLMTMQEKDNLNKRVKEVQAERDRLKEQCRQLRLQSTTSS